MIKELKNESSLDDLRICNICNCVYKDGETEVKVTDDGLLELRCPKCGALVGQFNEEGAS